MLTVRAVETAKPKDKPYKLADEKGLYLYVSPAGGKSFRANFKVNGKQQTRTYGRWPDLSLSDARKAHQAAKETPDTIASTTKPAFRVVAKRWLLKHLPSLSNPKHKVQVENTLERFVYPALGSRPIDQIKRAELVGIIEAVQKGDRIETAHRVAGRITAVFDYALDVGILEEAHPAANLTRVLIPRQVKKPMASIPPSEAGELLRAIQTYPDPVTRLGLLLMAHTFVRVSELLGMDKGEFKEGGDIWVVPPERVKGEGDKKLPHIVPMSPQSKSLVANLCALSDGNLVLDSPARPGHPLSENTLLFALYRLGYRGRMTVHGFRALASTVLNEQSGFPHDVIERQLAHKESDQVRAAYNRAEYLDQRRKLMNWWSAWLERAAADQQPASE
jgi:integrase